MVQEAGIALVLLIVVTPMWTLVRLCVGFSMSSNLTLVVSPSVYSFETPLQGNGTQRSQVRPLLMVSSRGRISNIFTSLMEGQQPISSCPKICLLRSDFVTTD